MNNIKSIVLILLFLCSIKSFAQNPFKLIKKAETNFKSGKFENALKKLAKAKKSKYCKCGNCTFEVDYLSYSLRYKIYSKQNKYQLARQSLDSILMPDLTIDSLKVVSYQDEIGKNILSNAIDTALLNSSFISDKFGDYILIIPLDFKNIVLRFKLPFETRFKLDTNVEESEKLKVIREDFIASPAYKLIKA